MNEKTKAAIERSKAMSHEPDFELQRRQHRAIADDCETIAAALAESQQIISEQEFMITASLAEVERLRADAARWQFIREHNVQTHSLKMNGQHSYRLTPLYGAVGPTITAAVDMAIVAFETKTGWYARTESEEPMNDKTKAAMERVDKELLWKDIPTGRYTNLKSQDWDTLLTDAKALVAALTESQAEVERLHALIAPLKLNYKESEPTDEQ
tara:strand:- start:6275 stop:6910 length:636 start_codon:yes stop_codon:yes gene_type:complete